MTISIHAYRQIIKHLQSRKHVKPIFVYEKLLQNQNRKNKEEWEYYLVQVATDVRRDIVQVRQSFHVQLPAEVFPHCMNCTESQRGEAHGGDWRAIESFEVIFRE